MATCLDGVSFGGNRYGSAQMQTVVSANIVLDDGIDAVYGGNNLAAGRGINASADGWAPQGPATVTPTGANIAVRSTTSLNLTSIVVTREGVGAAVLDVTFASPVDSFLFDERGFNSDLQVQSLNASNQVTGTYTILRANYAQTGIIITTDNGAFLNNGQQLGSIGLRSDLPISRLRLSSDQSDVLSFNGPDDKVLAVSAVPEPGPVALWLSGLSVFACMAPCRRTGRPGSADPRL